MAKKAFVQRLTRSIFLCRLTMGLLKRAVNFHRLRLSNILRLLFCAMVLLTLVNCGGGSGASVEQNAPTQSDDDDTLNSGKAVYTGPDPQTDDLEVFRDINNFKIYVWENLAVEERCGNCHVQNGSAPHPFARSDDITLAYEVATTITNLSAPSLSDMVTKLAGGHGNGRSSDGGISCWGRLSPDACVQIVAGYIQAWASASGAEPVELVLTPPSNKEVGASLNFPSTSVGFASTIYPVLRGNSDGGTEFATANCARCHAEDAPEAQQQPYFASSDVDVAYAAAKNRIKLDDPAGSRFVARLNESHNCWSGNCTTDAARMLTAIQDFLANGSDSGGAITPTEVDPDLAQSISRALVLDDDGIVASSGGRIESDAIALYTFQTGDGPTAFDTSGVDPAIPLALGSNVEWQGNWGIRIESGAIPNNSKAQASTEDSIKLYNLITATGEYSIETWVVPDNVTQDGPARIVSYSGSEQTRNFTLGQTLYNYDFLNRTSLTDENGEPAFSTPDADEVLQATLQHTVVTYDPINGRRIYVNGELIVVEDPDDPDTGGSLANWDPTFALVVGNEVNGQQMWEGTVRLLAIHNRSLTQEQIQANFDVGVGEKFFLLFGVGPWTDSDDNAQPGLIDMPQSYVVFQVEQFDNYSYLFNAPFFVSLDPSAVPTQDIPIRGIRIGINGREASVGQVFANVDTTITAQNYSASGVSLSSLGAVIALEKGSGADEFFLSFDQIGDTVYNRPAETVEDIVTPPDDVTEQADIGIRSFAEISATMSAITQVPSTNTQVASTYEDIKRGLPTIEDITTFSSAHQMTLTQLAVKYCEQLMADTTLRASYFSGINFSSPASTVFGSSSNRDIIIDALMANMVARDPDGAGPQSILTTQPDAGEMSTELNRLMDDMTIGCGATCADTPTVVTAICAAAVGSAVMLLQ